MREVDLYICIDGLGWEIAKRCPTFDFLSKTQTPLETVLGFSSSAIPTILTGKEADEHGCWNLFAKKPNQGDFPLFRWNKYFPQFMNRNRYIRKGQLILNKWYTQFSGYYQAYNYPSEKLYDIKISEERNIYSPGGIRGSKNIFDVYERNNVKYKIFSYKTHTEQEVFENLTASVMMSDVEKVFVYLPDFDAFGHSHATDEELMVQRACSYGERIRAVYEGLQKGCISVNLSVFSDHGMVPLTREFNILKSLQDYHLDQVELILDSTMARFYDLTESERVQIHKIFNSVPGKWLDSLDFKNYHIQFEGEYGQDIFVLDAGVQFSPSHMGKNSCAGMHGYLPENPMMKASFFSNREYQVNHIKDLFGIMTEGLMV